MHAATNALKLEHTAEARYVHGLFSEVLVEPWPAMQACQHDCVATGAGAYLSCQDAHCGAGLTSTSCMVLCYAAAL